jgi:transposase
MIELLIMFIQVLAGKRIQKNSRNSSVPPASDPNREKISKAKNQKKPGGHEGTTLEPVDNPDHTVELKIDRRKLPPGNWTSAGYERRQLFDLEIHRVVTEYQAEILINEQGIKITAEFPEGLVQKAQYGSGVKAQGVYMSVYQLIPCERVSEHFSSQVPIPVSSGSVCNFKQEAYKKLEWFEQWVKERLKSEKILHCDETGINIGGKRVWEHNASSLEYTLYYPHEKRGREAMDTIGVIPGTKAILIHDHWKPYYSYEGKIHGLCNAHHLRELTGAKEEGQSGAQPMIDLLLEIKEQVEDNDGVLEEDEQKGIREKYRVLLRQAEKECPASPEKPRGKRGRGAQSKPRNLLERLRDFEDDVLRFMTEKDVPFTNSNRSQGK